MFFAMAPATAKALLKFVGFYLKSQYLSHVFRQGKLSHGKNKGLADSMSDSHVTLFFWGGDTP